MTYSQLISDLTALKLHPLADTNVQSVTEDRGAAFLDFRGETVQSLEQRIAELEESLEASEAENDNLAQQIDELKNP
jgi:predicted RNase H-like nuclease (RuvC/YqgF family)